MLKTIGGGQPIVQFTFEFLSPAREKAVELVVVSVSTANQRFSMRCVPKSGSKFDVGQSRSMSSRSEIAPG